MDEKELMEILKNKKRMDLYLCEADFIKEFCKLATFFNLQIVSFLIAKLCKEAGLNQQDIAHMVMDIWEKNMEETVSFALKGYREDKRERVKKTLDHAKELAKDYIMNRLDLPPSAEDLEKMFNKL